MVIGFCLDRTGFGIAGSVVSYKGIAIREVTAEDVRAEFVKEKDVPGRSF
jgi:hypothetical protein